MTQQSELIRAQVIESYSKIVDSTARRMSSDPDVLEDLISVGLVQLVELAWSYDETRAATFPVYARQRIRGAMLDHLKRERIHYAAELTEEIAPTEAVAADVADAGQVLDMAELPDRQRQVIELRRRDFSQVQISRALGISRQAVSRLESRAMDRLRRFAAAA